MTGLHSILSKQRRRRIEGLTEEGLGTAVIAERLSLSRSQVYTHQVRAGLRTPKKRNLKRGGKDGEERN